MLLVEILHGQQLDDPARLLLVADAFALRVFREIERDEEAFFSSERTSRFRMARAVAIQP
jgi:hypothetical protein